MSVRSIRLAIVCVVSWLAAGSALAQSYTWLGTTNGNWSTASNWSPNGVPTNVSIDTAITFGATTNANITNDLGLFKLNSLTFSAAAPAYTLGGGTLSFQTNGSNVDPSITLNGSNSVTINNALIPEDCSGTLEVYGWNLLGDLSGCTFTGNGISSRGTIPLNTFGPLQDNGGPTLTHALLAGSTAIDSTYAQGCVNETGATLTTDQRGAARGAGVSCDVGAFEYVSPVATLDIDGSSTATKYDALTDGLLAIRYMFGLTGSSLTANAIGGTATRKDPAAIKAYLDGIRAALDIDGNGNVDALTDGLLVIRYLFGLRGAPLIQGAIAAGATRTTAAQIESYLATLTP